MRGRIPVVDSAQKMEHMTKLFKDYFDNNSEPCKQQMYPSIQAENKITILNFLQGLLTPVSRYYS